MLRTMLVAIVIVVMLSGCNSRAATPFIKEAPDVVRPLAKPLTHVDNIPPPRALPLVLATGDDLLPITQAANEIVSAARIDAEPQHYERVRNALHDVVTASACDVVIERVSRGEFPTSEQIEKILLGHAQQKGLTLFGVSDIAVEVWAKVESSLSGEPPDKLERIKNKCASVVGGARSN